MSIEQKHKKQIDAIIKQHFENSKNIEALTTSSDSKKALYELANKLATKFCLENGISSTDIRSAEVLNSFGNRVEKQSKAFYLADGFSFKTELTANRVVKSIETLARVNNTSIPATDITVDRSIASEFLPSYEKRVLELKNDKARYEKLLGKKVRERAKANYLSKLEETENELKGLTDTVEELTSGEIQFVTIRIPINPKDKFMNMPQREIEAIQRANLSLVDPSSVEVFQALKKKILKLCQLH